MFKKIFDLDPKEVEEFIRNKVIEDFKQYGNEVPEDIEFRVLWFPTCDEFYVHEEPKLNTKDYKSWSFRGKEITLPEYFEIQGSHWHFTFQEVYGQMTGETTFVEKVGYIGKTDIKEHLQFIYNKKWVDVIFVNNEWFVQEWEDSEDGDSKEIRKPVPADLLKAIYNLPEPNKGSITVKIGDVDDDDEADE